VNRYTQQIIRALYALICGGLLALLVVDPF